MAASVREGRLGGGGLHCDCDCDQDYKMTDTTVLYPQYTGYNTVQYPVPGTVYSSYSTVPGTYNSTNLLLRGVQRVVV